MKLKLKKTSVLLLISLIIISSFSLALNEGGEPTPEQIQSAVQNQGDFDNIQTPTAADLTKVENPTPEQFARLSPLEQGKYLGQGSNFDNHPEFVQKYYSDPTNWGLNAEADKVLFEGTRFRDLLKTSLSQVSAAEQYFSNKFPADYEFKEIGPDFKYDPNNGMLYNLPGKVNVKDTKIKTITAFGENNEFGIRVLGLDGREAVVIGEKEAGERLITFENGRLVLTDSQNRKQEFTFTGEETTKFNLKKDAIEIEGPVSVILPIDNEHEYARINNLGGKITISKNCNIEAENAIVETALIYLDGKFSYNQEKNIAEAFDHGDNRNGGYTIVVDKGSRLGAKTQGQNSPSKLTVHFSGVAPYSAFAPADPNAKPPENLKQVIEKIKNTKPPSPDLCTPSAGTSCQNAELYIDKDEFGRVIATAKGPVDVGFYNVAQGIGVTPSPTEPHFIGENGLSELDLSKGTMQVQINLRGKTTYTDNQYASYEGTGVKDGIRTREDGASVKIIRNEVNSEDVIYAECHQIGQGVCQKGAAAVDISKTIALATKAGVGIFTDPDYESVKISLEVSDDQGSLKYDWDEYKKNLGAIAEKQTDGKEMILGRTINMKSVVCEGNQECNLVLTQNKDGTAESFYELYDPQTKTVSKRVGIKTNLGKSYGQATILTSEKNIEKLQQMRDLIGRGAYLQIQQVFAKAPFEDDQELRNLVFKESGIDISKLGSKDYMDRIGTIAKYHTEAKNMIKSLSENYGIDLDEFGQPLTLEDQERLSDVMTKKRGTQGSVIFDQYTRAKVALANAEVQDKLAAHLACAGSSFCSVSDSDWKEAQKKLITEVKHRESSAEYKQWQDTVKKQEEAVKKAEEAAEYLGGMINKYATHISQTISGDLSTAELLGEEYRKARNQQGKFQDTEESNKNAEESKKVRLEAVNKNLENAKKDIGKFEEAAKTRALARKSAASKTGEIFKEITKDDWSEEDKHEYDLLRNTLASKEADVYALNLLSVNAPLNEYSALAGVQKLVDDCQGNSICEAEMWNAAGFSRKAADTVITADLPNSIKASLTDDYGFSAQQEVFDTLDESSQKYSDERKKTEELIKQGESGKIGTIFADYVQYLSEDEQVKLAQSIDKGDSKEIVTTLEKVQQKEQDSITSRVTAIASGKDAIKVAKSIMQRTGNEAAGNSILKSLPSELRETAEFKEADHLAAVISDERLKEKEQERIASAKALQNKREGRDSSMFDGVTWENSGVLEYATSKFLQGGGEVFDYVGEGLYDGGRYMVGYTSKGYGYAASAVGLESFGEGAIKAGEIIITEKETEEQKLDRDIQFFTDQAEEFRQAQLFINKQRAEGKTTVQALSALEGVTGDVSTSLALKNIARQGRRQLTANERGEEAFAEAEIAEREHGQYMVDGMYQNVIDIAAGQDEELTRRALEKLGESNEIIGIGGVGLTQRDAAIVVPLAKQIVLSVDNFIPGVLIAKAAKAGVKVARVIGEVSKISKAIEAVGDAAKLWKATEQAADLYRVSKAAVQEAEAVAKISKTAENIAKLEKAKESLKGAEAVLTVEKASQQTRLGKVLGREYYLGLTRKGEDLIAVEKAQKSLTTDLALITSKLDDARRSNAAPETINLLEQSSSALIKKSDDLDRATEALHLAGLDSVTEGRAGLKQYGLAIEAGGESKLPITIGLQRQSKLADDFQKARETFLAERIAVGADKVRPETINKLIETAKAREYDSITKTINSAIKTRLNAQRVGQNLDKLEQAGISVKFSEGKYVGEIAAGTSEARLLDSVNELIKDDEVLGRVVTGRIKEIPELAPAEADRLGSLSDELSEVTDVTIDGPSTLHVDPDTVPPGWEGTPAEFGDKAREYNALVAKADPGDIISEVRTGVEAQASTLANDKQVAALAVKDDLARRVSGESSTGVTAQVVGKEASELPKVRQVPDTEIMGDIPTPTSVEAGQRSAVLGSSDIGDIPLAGEPSKVLPLEKLPTAMTTPEQNAQRVVGLLPEVGQDVKVETVAGNVFEGTLKYSDEEMLYLEKFDEQQKILTSRVTEVEVPPKTVELEEVSLEGKVVNDNAFDPCNVAAAAIYGFAVPCVRPTPQIPLETRVLTPEDLPSSQITPEVLPIAEEIVPPPTARTADDFLVHYDLEGMNVEQRSGLQKWVTEAQGRFNDETIQQALPRQIEIFSGNPAKLSEEGKALESLVDAGYSPVEIRNAEKYLGEAKKLRDLPLQQGDLVHATTSDNALEIISSGQLKKSTGEGAQFGEGVYTVEAKASGKLKDVSAETSSYLSRTDITTGETSPVLVRVKPEYVDQHPPITKGATAQTRIFADDIPVEHLEFNSGQGWKSADEFVSSDKAAQLSKEMGDIPVTVDKSGKVSAEGLNLDDFQIVGEDVFSKSTGKKLSDEAAKVVLDEKQFLEFAPETIPFPGKVPEQLVQDNKLLFANREEFPALKGPQGRYSPFRFEDEDKQRLIAYSIEDRKVAEAAGKIFENVPASQLPSGQYTYVLLEDGTLVFGKVETELEFGVKHLHLANERPVVAAGEIVVEESGEYAFNSLSGTITKPLKDQQLEKFTAEVGSDLAQTKVTEYEQAVKDNMDSIFENYFGRKGDSTHVSVIGFEKESTLDELIDICAKNIGLNLPACGAQLDLKPLIDERVAALAAETVPAPIVSVTGTEIEISPSKFWQSEPLPLERRVELTPTEISREIETIKEGYASQKIDLEKIISNHPTVKVKQADVTFTGKLGEGTVGAVYEGSIPGVGDSLAFKTAKATPGELGRIRGNLADNVDSLFKELEQSREACKLVPCPGYYGIYEIDGVPYLVSDKVKGRHFFDLNDQDIIKYLNDQKIKKFKQDLTKAIDAGWNPTDIQAMVLTEPQVLNGVQYQAGDILFMDVAEWRLSKVRVAGNNQKLVDIYFDWSLGNRLKNADKVSNLKGDFEYVAKAVEEIDLEDLRAALTSAGYQVPEATLKHLSDSDTRLIRMYEVGIDPLLVSPKISEAKALRLKSSSPLITETIEKASLGNLHKALEAADYELTPEALKYLEKGDERIARMFDLGIDPLEVSKRYGIDPSRDVFFDLEGKLFFKDSEGKWVQKREGSWKFLGNKEATSSERKLLDDAYAEAFPETVGTKVVDPELIAANKAALGDVAADPRVQEALGKLDVPINCKVGFVGRAGATSAVADCIPSAIATNPEQYAQVQELNRALEGSGKKVEIEASPSLLDEVAEAERAVPPTSAIDPELQKWGEKAKQAVKDQTSGEIGKGKFVFETPPRKTLDGRVIPGETVNGVQTVTYSGANRFDVEIINPTDNSRVASYSYVVDGNELDVVDVFVPPRYQGAGVNTRLTDQTFDLHPGIEYTRGSLVGTNKEAYVKYLRDNPGADLSDAMRNTPAYKTKLGQGFDIDVKRSNLPTLEEAEKGADIILVSKKRGTTELPTSEIATESIRPTRATHKGDGVFDLDGKNYYKEADGNWQQVVPDEERSGWQKLWGTNKNQEIPDEDYFRVSGELNNAEFNTLSEGVVKVDPEIVDTNTNYLRTVAGDDFVNNPEVKGMLGELDQGITCGTGGSLPSTGLAANCIPYLQNLNQRHKERIDRLNELLRKEGKPQIKVTYKAPETPVSVPIVSGAGEIPLTAAVRKEGNVYTLDGVDYYDTADGWKTTGLIGRKNVKDPSVIVDLNEGKYASITRGESVGVPEVGKPLSVEVKPIEVKGTLVRQETEYIVIRDADGLEIKLKKTELEPGSMTGPGEALDRHIQPGQEFSISSVNNVYSGKMIGIEGDFLVVETQGEKRFFGILPGKKEKIKLRADALNYNTQIPMGTEISIKTKSKRVNGILAGEDASGIRVIDGGVEVPIRKGDIASDSIMVEGTKVDVIVNGEVTSGKYVSEGPTYVSLVDDQGRQISVAKLGEDVKVVPSAGVFEAPITTEETRKVFQEVDLAKLSGKSKKEIVGEFYETYNHKTVSSSPVESGRFPVGIGSPELKREIGTELILVDEGWVRMFSKTDYPRENVMRFYFNSKDSESAKKVAAYFNENLGKRNIPFEMKISAEKVEFAARTDNTVLYFDGARRKEVEEMLAGLDPGLLDDEVPLFSKKIRKGVSWAEDPNNKLLEAGMTSAEFKKKLEKYAQYELTKSFGQERSEALAEIYSITNGEIGPEFDDITKEIFRKYGIDPDEPWLNLNSKLKEPSAEALETVGSKVVNPELIAEQGVAAVT